MLMFGALALAVQQAPPKEVTHRDFELMKSELSEIERELTNARFEVARNAAGTIWTIKAGDIDAWTDNNSLIWVEVDTSQNPIYSSAKAKELWRLDCRAKTHSLEISQSFDRQGELTNTYTAQASVMGHIYEGSPVDKVRIAFCPPEFE
jgi:hypothetical protein